MFDSVKVALAHSLCGQILAHGESVNIVRKSGRIIHACARCRGDMTGRSLLGFQGGAVHWWATVSALRKFIDNTGSCVCGHNVGQYAPT